MKIKNILFITLVVLLFAQSVLAIAAVEPTYGGKSFPLKDKNSTIAYKDPRLSVVKSIDPMTTPLRGVISKGKEGVLPNPKPKYEKPKLEMIRSASSGRSSEQLPPPGTLVCCPSRQLKNHGFFIRNQCDSASMLPADFVINCKASRGMYITAPNCQIGEATCEVPGVKKSKKVAEAAWDFTGRANATYKPPYKIELDRTVQSPLLKTAKVNISGKPTSYTPKPFEKTSISVSGVLKNAAVGDKIPAEGTEVCCDQRKLQQFSAFERMACRPEKLTAFTFQKSCKGARGVYVFPPSCQFNNVICTVPKQFAE